MVVPQETKIHTKPDKGKSPKMVEEEPLRVLVFIKAMKKNKRQKYTDSTFSEFWKFTQILQHSEECLLKNEKQTHS